MEWAEAAMTLYMDLLRFDVNSQDMRLLRRVQPEGAGPLTWVPVPTDPLPLTQLDSRAQAVVAALERLRDNPGRADTQPLTQAGQALFQRVMTKDMRDLLREAPEGDDLVLTVDQRLVHVPWELMHDGQSFLCERLNVGRIVAVDAPKRPVRNRPPPQHVAALILGDPTDALPWAAQERDTLARVLREKLELAVTKPLPLEITPEAVNQWLTENDIVVFAGHSGYRERPPAERGWVLNEGAIYGPSRIREQALVDSPFPRLIVSNACSTGPQAPWDNATTLSDMAQAFLHGGVRHYVGTLLDITDAAANAHFSQVFIRALVGDEPSKMGEALRQARLALRDTDDPAVRAGQFQRFSYVLFGDPRPHLLDITTAPSTSPPPIWNYLWDIFTREAQGDWAGAASRLSDLLAQTEAWPNAGEWRDFLRERRQTALRRHDAQPTTPPPAHRSRLGPYAIERTLSSHNHRTTYQARAESGPPVHLIVSRASDESEAEARIAGLTALPSLTHPGLPQVFAVGREGDDVYLAQAATSDPTLADVLQERQRLTPLEGLGVALQVCDALAVAHQRGLPHLNLNPSSLRLRAESTTIVADTLTCPWRVTVEGLGWAPLSGQRPPDDLRYAGPDQLRSRSTQPSVDVWALAAILYTALTGQPPFITDPDTEEMRHTRLPQLILHTRPPHPARILAPLDRLDLGVGLTRPLASTDSMAFLSDLFAIVMQGLSQHGRYTTLAALQHDLVVLVREGRLSTDFEQLLRAELAPAPPLLHIVTEEEEFARDTLRDLTEAAGRSLYTWSATAGLRDSQGRQPPDLSAEHGLSLSSALTYFVALKTTSVLVVLDHHRWLGAELARSEPTPSGQTVVALPARRLGASLLADSLERAYLRLRAQATQQTIVLLAPTLSLPDNLVAQAPVLFLPFPHRQRINQLIVRAGGDLADPFWEAFNWTAVGLHSRQIERLLNLSRVQHGKLDESVLDDLLRAKVQWLQSVDVLECIVPRVKLNAVVGAEWFVAWMRHRLADEPRAMPHGLVLIGVPGCGKSMAAQAVAGEWGMPLLRLDLGRIMGPYVGQAEHNLHAALTTAVRFSPAILWIDELDKAVAGMANAAMVQPTLGRLMAHLFTWLQEHKAPILTIATANELDTVPPAMIRSGRFDELVFFDVPNEQARLTLIRGQLPQADAEWGRSDLRWLAQTTRDFTPAEIVGCLQSARYEAAADGRPLDFKAAKDAIEGCKARGRRRPEEYTRLRQLGRALEARWASTGKRRPPTV